MIFTGKRKIPGILIIGLYFLSTPVSKAQDLTPTVLINLILNQPSDQSAEALIKTFGEKGSIPYTNSDSCLFIYLGNAESVQWNGDFNGWGRDTTFNNVGELIRNGIWALKAKFVADGRFDYKLVVDGNWIIDPLNPYQQFTGMGGGIANSELRMPDWKPEPYTKTRDDIVTGTVTDHLISSEKLKRKVSFKIYYPSGYTEGKAYPILYFTDGQEYSDPRMGAAVTVLDNLISDKMIPPAVAVFFDPRDPDNLQNNLRISEYDMNGEFLDFFVLELLPEVEDSLNVQLKEDARAIIGTSLGGLNAAYFALSMPEVFSLVGIQSPAFSYKPEIYRLCEDFSGTGSLRIYMSTGVIHDNQEDARKMMPIFQEKKFVTYYQEVNESHSWGNWKAFIDDMLIFLLENFHNK